MNLSFLFLALLVRISTIHCCSAGYFPKVLGGSIGDTILGGMKMHLDTQRVAVFGNTYDQSITDPSNTYKDFIIALYEGPEMTLKWTHYIPLTSGLELDIVGFSLDGGHIFALTSPSVRIFQFSAKTGQKERVIQAFSITTPTSIFHSAEMNGAGKLVFIALRSLIVCDMNSMICNRGYSPTNTYNRGATFGEWQNIAYHIISHNELGINRILINRINIDTDVMIKDQYIHDYTSYVNSNFEVAFRNFTEHGKSFLYTGMVTDLAVFQRLQIDTLCGNIASSDIFETTIDPAAFIYGIHPLSPTKLQAVFGLTNSAIPYQVVLANIDMQANVATFKNTLPSIGQYSKIRAAFYSADNFVLCTQGTFFIIDSSNSFTSVSPQATILIFQSVENLSCGMQYRMDSIQTQTISKRAPGFNSFLFEYTKASYTIIDISSSYPPYQPLDISQVTTLASCSTPQYSIAPMSALETFAFTVGNHYSFPVTPITPTKICSSAANPVVTYSATLNDLSPLPPFITFDSPNMQLVISSAALPGVYYVQVKGQLQDGLSQYKTYILMSNNPPEAQGIADLRVNLNVQAIQIIKFNDIDGDKVSYSFHTKGGTTLPSFIQYDQFLEQLVLSPTEQSQLGMYHLVLELTDNKQSSSYEFTVEILDSNFSNLISALTNLGPPIFTDSLSDLTVEAGKTSTFIFPSITDPDGDSFALSLTLGDALSLAIYKDSTLQISPLLSDYKPTPYEIKIKLTDNNAYPKFQTYTIKIYITQPIALEIPQANQTLLDTKNASTEPKLSPSDLMKTLKHSSFKLKRPTQNGKLDLLLTESDPNLASQLIRKLISQQSTILKVKIVTFNGSYEYPKNFTVSFKDYRSVTIQIEFGIKVSNGQELDSLQVSILRDIEAKDDKSRSVIRKGTQDAIVMPSQISIEQYELIQSMQDSAQTASYILTPGSILLNFFLQLCIQLLWNMLNDLSFMMSLSMVSVNVPGIAQVVQRILLGMIYLDLLDTSKWIDPIISSDEDGLVDQSLNPYFELSGFQSLYMLKNLGSTLVFVFMYVMAFVLSFVCRWMKSFSQKFTIIGSKIDSMIYWNGSLRFLIQQFQPLLLSSLINLCNLSEATSLSTIASMLSIISTFMIEMLVGVVIYIIIVGKGQTFDPLSKGFNQSTFIGRYWMVLTLMKWNILCAILVFGRDQYYAFQIVTLLGITVLFQILIIKGKPHVELTENIMSFVNEVMSSLYIYSLITFTEYNGENPLRDLCSMGLLGIVGATFAVNIGKFLIQTGKIVINKVNAWYKARNAKFRVVKLRPVQVSANSPTNLLDVQQQSNDKIELPSLLLHSEEAQGERTVDKTNMSVHERLTFQEMRF
ncbi:hypothetical protein FGO68_gene3639 [Halteria grandinella]|uniref:Cadherin domain-containing protein n=1 Tax=Halteria grandinella TaxID=5974 RepID=A0A8J8T8E0_HALGN|nr:hypothetical protein FGO68_gene3639 [Halteria grandinella]